MMPNMEKNVLDTVASAKAAGSGEGGPGDHDLIAFHSLFDNAPCGMLLVDKRGQIARANTRLLHMFGY